MDVICLSLYVTMVLLYEMYEQKWQSFQSATDPAAYIAD